MTPTDIVVRALTIAATALGSAGFVAGVGGAILWARFDAAQLPADQSVAAVASQELVVVGAVALAGFLLAAVGALLLVYLLDNEGTAGTKTRVGLVVLMFVEIAIAIVDHSFKLREALVFGAGFAIAGVGLIYLLDLLAGYWKAAAPQSRYPRAIARHLWRGLLGDANWLRRVLRAIALAWLALGVVLLARATQPLPVVLWACVALVMLGICRRARPGDPWLGPIAVLALLAYGITALVRFEGSLAIVAGVAVALGAVNLAVAKATGLRFALYGISVFLSVVLFGAALSYVNTRQNPQLQGIAVALKDGPVRCGLYVAETDSRLYLARVRVVARRRGAEVVADSGRIVSVPRDRIERIELGPLQGVVGAQENGDELREELDVERRQDDPPEDGKALIPATPGGPPAGNETVQAMQANGCVPGDTPAAPRPSAQRDLAKRFQPRLVVDRDDGFWPISALTMFKLRRGQDRTCRNVASNTCPVVPRANALPWTGGVGEWLEFPGDDTGIGEQAADMTRALESSDPARTARQYFFVTSDEKRGTTSVQYWYFYLFNYQKLRVKGVTLAKAGFHEGDFETVGVLLNADKNPVYMWMARHAPGEGRPFVWSESALAKTGRHATVYAAIGSHATYESCATQKRTQLPNGIINDRTQCDPLRQLTFEPAITPLSDLALAPWACWQGRFGHSSRSQRSGAVSAALADGPASPLWQQRFGRSFSPCAGVAQPLRPEAGEEVLDDATATELRRGGAVLDGSFDSCADWEKPPPSGVYVVACNDAALRGFFASGLMDLGDSGLAITGTAARPQPASMPAVWRRPTAVKPDGVTLRARKAMTVRVYATCYADQRRIVVTFPSVPLKPGQEVVLKTGERSWTLTGEGTSSTAPVSGGGRCSA